MWFKILGGMVNVMKTLMKIFAALLLLTNCSSITVPSDYVYKEVETRNFTIVTWQKITNPQGVYKIYIEGDGYAFNSHGKPTHAPTPRGTLVRELAFGDKSPNVIYLARPCQYIKSPMCSQRHWTTARFAPEIINAEYETIRQIAGNNPVVLVGFSGGAQVAGLVATAKRGLNVKKIITIAGNLDHLAWTQYHNLPPLNEAMNLESYHKQFAELPQIHYVGNHDKVMPPILIREFVDNDDLIIEVDGASHNEGWESIYNQVWSEK